VVAPAAGAVVLVRFPFSDLSKSKLRPALVLADAGRGDRVLCQITSKPYGDARAVQLEQSAFVSGSLRVTSYARPAKLFTASGDLITKEIGVLAPEALVRVVDAVMNLLRGSASDQS
jgi:mRNA interferase MazF